ncbi:response regulator transcription factor CtrA [Rickettsia rickettsii]|uniref:response regulator transcription factor CtrA n=1 Tax=Rickettsia rickettsii TaxID=783 RepID=UPI00024F9D98|nr:response regulator transcription factor [Rickettsia rickettsii]AFB28420.1 cell cycle transcriptional regulator [Rickettsia rickettsii str. Hlp\
MRVLLIEGEPEMANLIELTLASEGIVCDKASVGVEGLRLGKVGGYDLVILDLMLPDINGFEILLRLRAAKIKTPILILSSLTDTYQKITDFSSGADDYLTKPFVREELIARIKAIVRRSKGHAASVFRFDKVSINLDTRSVEVDGKKVHLTNKEYAILELLILRRGTILTKEMFLNHLYSSVDEPEMKIIDVFICKLRKKLSDAAGGRDYIDTVWGRGYMLKEYDELQQKEILAQGA